MFSPEHMDVFSACSGCAKKSINILLWTAMITGNTSYRTCRYLQKTWLTFQTSGLLFERLTHSSSFLYAFLVHRRILTFLCAPRIHKEHVHVFRKEHLEVFPIVLLFAIRKSVLGMSKLFRGRVLPFKLVWLSCFSSHWRSQLESWYIPWNHDGYEQGPMN